MSYKSNFNIHRVLVTLLCSNINGQLPLFVFSLDNIDVPSSIIIDKQNIIQYNIVNVIIYYSTQHYQYLGRNRK